ncbi:hypothetical protein D3C76_669910 [compost metagenome]
MNGRRDLARGTGHAPVGNQRHLEATVLQHTEERCELVQLGHAVAARALEAHHGDEVALQLAGLERIGQRLLVLEHPRRGLYHLMLRGHGGDFHHPTPQVAFHHPQPALGRERPRHRAQDALVEALQRAFAPDQLAVVEERLLGVAAQAVARDGVDVFVQQPGIEQLADQEGHAASGLEVVDVGFAIGVDMGQRRHHLGQVGHVLPGELNARRLGDRRHVQGVVGRAAGGMQGDDRVDQRLLVDDLAQWHEAAAGLGQARDLLRGLGSERIAQRRIGVHERGAWQVQPHHFHHQLVGVGGAVEGAGAGAVVGVHLRLQQLLAAGLALGIALAHVGLLLVGDAREHRATWHENGRQVPETQRAHHQAGDDLVADAEHQRGVEHVVRQGHGGGHGDHFTAGDGQLHARLALGHAVAHGRHATGELADRADLAQGLLDLLGEVLVRLVRREHVVVGRDDGDVGRIHQPQALLVLGAATGHAVGEVGALQAGTHGSVTGRAANQLQVAFTGGTAAFDQPLGDLKDARVHVLDSRLTVWAAYRAFPLQTIAT